MLKQIFNCSCLFFTLAILIIIAKYIFQSTREGWRNTQGWGNDEAQGKRNNCKTATSLNARFRLLYEVRVRIRQLREPRLGRSRRLWLHRRIRLLKYKIRQHYIDQQWCRRNQKWYYVWSGLAQRWVMAREARRPWRGRKYILYYWKGMKWMWKPHNRYIYSAIRWRT